MSIIEGPLFSIILTVAHIGTERELYEFIQSSYKDILLEVMEKKMEATFLDYIAIFSLCHEESNE